MKRLLLIFTLALMACIGFAQANNYVFSQTTGAYSEITGGTLLGGGGVDDTSYPNQPMFPFYYNGIRYSTFSVNANGFIAMGPTISSSYTPISTGSTNNVISGMSRDIKARPEGELRYEVLGTAPNRTLVVQWKAYARYQGTITVTDNFNFQIRLHESSNLINVAYGPFTVDPLDMFSYPEVGLRGGTNADFNNRTTTIDWSATTAGTLNNNKCTLTSVVYPNNGLIFEWMPPAPSAVPNNATIVSPLNGAMGVFASSSLNWADGGGWTNGFKLYFGTDNPPTNLVNGTDLGYVTTYVPASALAFNTEHFWRIAPYNGFGDNDGGTVWSFTTAGAPLSGIKTIGAGGDFETFTAAISQLNGSGVGTGGVTFNVLNGTYAENPPAITASGTMANPIVFQAAAGAQPVLTPAGGAGTFGFKLEGADYVTFNNIDINGPNTLIYGYWLTSGAQNVNIWNCDITIPYGTSINYGIYSLGITGNPNSYLNTVGNNVAGSYHGIYVTGSSTAGSETQGVNISQNGITGVRNYAIYHGYGIGTVINDNNISFATGATTTFYGIYSTGTTNTTTISNNVINGGSTSTSVYGIYPVGGNNEIFDNVVSNITITGTGTFYGAYLTTGNNNFYGNTITGLYGGGTIYGLYIIGGTTHNVYNNRIHDLSYTGTSSYIVYGLSVSSGTTNNVYNNMIYDLRSVGGTTAPQIRALNITGGTNDNIWYNTVYLNASGTNANYATAAMYMTSGTTVDLKNNIFVNLSTPGATGRSVAFWKTVVGFANISTGTDKNIYWTGESPGALNPICYNGTLTYATLGEYKVAIATKDQGSYAENVPFLSSTAPYDLHINPSVMTRVEGNAIPIAGIGYDIDMDARHATMPDIGADEGNFTPVSGPPAPATAVNPANGAVMVPVSAVLQWSPGATGGTPTGYQVFFGTTPTPPFIQDQTGATYSPTLVYNQTYYWQIIPFNGDGYAVGSPVWSFTVQPDPRVNLPYTENFDAGPPNIAISPTNSWVVGTPAKTYLNGAYSAPNALVTRSLTAQYGNLENMSATLQINTTGVERSLNIEFKQKFVCEGGWDGMVLEYSIDNQATWTKWDAIVGTGPNWDTPTSTYWYNNTSTSGPVVPPKWSGVNSSTLYAGHSNGWLPTTTVIPHSVFSAAGNLSLRWRFGSDGSGVNDGFAIDDIYIWETPPTTIAPDPVTMVTPLNDATNVDPRTVVLDWAPAATGGAVETYDLYIGNDDDPYGSYYFAVAAPISQFSPFADGAIVLDYNSRWYWTVQPVNSAGFPDIEDCDTWSFTTRSQMSSSVSSIDLGPSYPGSVKNGSFTVNNLGATQLDFSVSGSPELSFNIPRTMIPPQGSQIVQWTFNTPMQLGAYNGSIVLQENTPSNTSITIPFSATVAEIMQIGNGTTTNMSLPVEPYWTYTYSQSVYLQSEINVPGKQITSVSYSYNGNSAWSEPNIDIYMGHTTRTAFASTSDYEPLANLTLVYSGPYSVMATPGWVNFTLQTPFVYNNVDNLIIAVNENGGPTSTYHSSADEFYCTAVTGNRSLFYYNDSSGPYNPADPTLIMSSGLGTPAYIPNTLLGLEDAPATLDAPEIITFGFTGGNMEIEWTAVAGASGYRVYGSADPYAPAPWTLMADVLAPDTEANFPAPLGYYFYYVMAYSGTRQEIITPFRINRK